MATRKGDDKGGDKGKSPNVTGTQPGGQESRSPDSPGRKAVQGGSRKTPARTTARSGDK